MLLAHQHQGRWAVEQAAQDVQCRAADAVRRALSPQAVPGDRIVGALDVEERHARLAAARPLDALDLQQPCHLLQRTPPRLEAALEQGRGPAVGPQPLQQAGLEDLTHHRQQRDGPVVGRIGRTALPLVDRADHRPAPLRRGAPGPGVQLEEARQPAGHVGAAQQLCRDAIDAGGLLPRRALERLLHRLPVERGDKRLGVGLAALRQRRERRLLRRQAVVDGQPGENLLKVPLCRGHRGWIAGQAAHALAARPVGQADPPG